MRSGVADWLGSLAGLASHQSETLPTGGRNISRTSFYDLSCEARMQRLEMDRSPSATGLTHNHQYFDVVNNPVRSRAYHHAIGGGTRRRRRRRLLAANISSTTTSRSH